MARKGTKIKRYGSIYGRASGSFTIILAMVVGLVIFGVLGWSLYTPVHDFIMRLGEERIEASAPVDISSESTASSGVAEQVASSSSPSALPNSSSSSAAAIKPEASSSLASSQPSQGQAATDESALKGIYIPAAQLLDDRLLAATLEDAVAAGFNTVMVDAKDATGKVLYSSENSLGKSVGIAAENVYNAKKAADSIKAQGMVSVARIHAFRDSLAPIAERDMSVHYFDTEVYWLDNSPELGGKPWINPYSKAAQQYIISLSEELCESGFDVIMLDSVQFPSGYALNKAGYGEEAKKISRAQVLKQFVADIKNAVEAKGAKLVICTSDNWLPDDDADKNKAINAANELYYGGSPTAYFTEKVAITLPDDALLWNDTIARAQRAQSTVEWIGFVPAYTADGAFTDSAALVEAFLKTAENEYVLFNPQGSYKFR